MITFGSCNHPVWEGEDAWNSCQSARLTPPARVEGNLDSFCLFEVATAVQWDESD